MNDRKLKKKPGVESTYCSTELGIAHSVACSDEILDKGEESGDSLR